MILAGDIGATNSRLAFFSERSCLHMTCRSMSPASEWPAR